MSSTIGFLRGLTLGLSLSVLNLVGMFLTFLLLGGLGEWTRIQFMGVFGIFEVGTAIAFVLCPNVWRLPVVEAEKSEHAATQLAASVVFIPHWAGAAKAVAGVVMIAVAGYYGGFGLRTLFIPAFALATGVLVVAASAVAARWGVSRPDLDVVQVTVSRPGHKDAALPGVSISAAALQIILGAFTIPVIKVLPPSALFGPEIGPSPAFLTAMVVAATVTLAAALVTWRGQISIRATPEQQQIAEDQG